jgi:hypothetical protein
MNKKNIETVKAVFWYPSCCACWVFISIVKNSSPPS